MTTTKNNEHKKLNFPSEREQSQACLNSAEHEKNQGRKVLNVPNLRFPEFEGEWEKCKLGDKCDLLCGYAFDGKNIVEQGTYLLMRGINITEGIIRHSSELDRYYTGSVNNLAKYKLTTGDLVIGMDGSKVGRNSAIVSLTENGSYLVQRVCRIKSCIGNDFLLQLVNNHKFHKYVDMVKTSSAIPHISLKDIQNFPIAVPSIQKEADKISKLFHLLDERIATQNKIIDKLQSLIKGIVDCTILRKEKNAIVGDVCSISEQIRAEANIDDIITVRLHGNGVCKSSAENLQLGATQYYRRRAGQLIYGKQNFHNGAIGIVPISLDNGITSKDIPSFDIDEMKCNSVYLLAQLQSPQYYKPAEALTTGTGSKRLKEETFLKMPIVLPNKREQDNIAVLIHRASMNLDYAKRLLELLSIQKQFLLRQMFI